jgi:hypothetical protein
MDSATPKPRKKTPQNAGKVAAKAIAEAKASAEIAPEKKKTGRPSKYTPEIAQEMCNRLANGEPLRQICRDEGFPAWQTVYDWMYRDDALGDAGVGLSGAIAKAREIGQDAIAEQIWLEVNQEPERILSEGGGRVDSGYVQWQKVKAEIGLKLLAKWNPKRYGDKIALGGDPGNPLQTQVDVTIFDTLVQTLETRRQDKANG